jgi:PRTRC genetic system ThiF family protein
VKKERIHYVDAFFLRDHPIHITVIGVGGTGTLLLKELARIHYTLVMMGKQGLHVTAYDSDIISESNIGRQLFQAQDVGENKAINIIHKINLAWGIHWNAVPEKFDSKSQGHSIIISCVDSIAARKEIANYCNKGTVRFNHNIFEDLYYWIDCGNGSNFGQVMLFRYLMSDIPKSRKSKYDIVDKIPYVDIFKGKEDVPDEPSCSLAQALGKQDLLINSMITQIVCQMLWQIIDKKWIDYKGVYLNLATMTMRPVPL